MKLKIVKNYASLGISIINTETMEVFESGYESMEEAREALKNFKEMYE